VPARPGINSTLAASLYSLTRPYTVKYTIAMDGLRTEHERLAKKSNLSKTIKDVDETIALIRRARDAISNGKLQFGTAAHDWFGIYV
jgi:hypothetical protein